MEFAATDFYYIEEHVSHYGPDPIGFRFVSLYNGTNGRWRETRESAVADGRAHAELIASLHGHTISARELFEEMDAKEEDQ